MNVNELNKAACDMEKAVCRAREQGHTSFARDYAEQARAMRVEIRAKVRALAEVAK